MCAYQLQVWLLSPLHSRKHGPEFMPGRRIKSNVICSWSPSASQTCLLDRFSCKDWKIQLRPSCFRTFIGQFAEAMKPWGSTASEQQLTHPLPILLPTGMALFNGRLSLVVSVATGPLATVSRKEKLICHGFLWRRTTTPGIFSKSFHAPRRWQIVTVGKKGWAAPDWPSQTWLLSWDDFP